MSCPKVFIIIVNWNGLQDTIECLESVFKLNYNNFKVVVVDNGSSDGSCIGIKEKFTDIILIENDENLGFAEGNNVGMRYALQHGADYVFLLNNDTIVDSHILNELLKASLKFNDKGIFGAQIYYHSKPAEIWYSGVRWVPSISIFLHENMGLSKDTIEETDYACGCALFLSTRVIERIGLFDRKYFLTFEEADWCSRARLGGIRSYCVANAIVYHKISNSFGGSSSPLISYFLTRNSLLWGERYLSLKEYIELIVNTIKRIQWLSYRGSEYKRHSFRLISIFIQHYRKKYYSVASQASYLGLRDYLLRKFGNCPFDVSLLASIESQKKSTYEGIANLEE